MKSWFQRKPRIGYVPLAARTSVEGVASVPVKEAYYTAGRGPMTPTHRGLNHTLTYVVDGNQYGIPSDLLVGTGNPIIGLPPAVERVVGSVEEEEFMQHSVTKLSRAEERRILTELGLLPKK